MAAGFVLAGCASEQDAERSPAPEAPAPASSNPLGGQPIYVDPASHAARQAAQWRAQGRTADADAMSQLADRPTAFWVADGADVSARARSVARRAAAAGETALMVAYWVPGRDCGSFSAGGASSADAYRGWIRAFARGLGQGRTAVILEPDAIPQAVQGCLSAAARAERYALLSYAVRKLTARPRVSVYIDAGNPGWIRPAGRLVGPLRAAGIAKADGFALNVSNFHRTGANIAYGRRLSRRLGGAHFVIDTGRNGNGPQAADDARGPKWCNPPGRAVGADPTTSTGRRRLDAYLWVKEPGKSDGTCRGGPPAGHWWPEYALALVRNR